MLYCFLVGTLTIKFAAVTWIRVDNASIYLIMYDLAGKIAVVHCFVGVLCNVRNL